MAQFSINPATGESIREFPEIPIPELVAILEKVDNAQREWAASGFGERADCFRKLAQLLRADKGALADTMATEMGKPVTQGESEAEKCAWVCEFFADNGPEFLRELSIPTEKAESYVLRQPLGVVFAIMPWNFPFWQLFRAAVPALMAGNGVALKHAPNVPQCALTVEALFQRAGFPTHLLRTLLIDHDSAAVAIVHDSIRAITLTGSTYAGQTVAAQAGSQIKKCVLELGGADPYIVRADADLEQAAQTLTVGRMINNGQSCIAVKRILADQSIAGELTERILANMRAYAMNNPMDAETRLGPIARPDLRDRLHNQVAASIAMGARCLLGGEIPKQAGNWYPATVLDAVQPGMPVFDEETFGPVAVITETNSDEHALELANRSPFGLGGGVLSRDIERARELAVCMDTGNVAINDFVKSDPRLPFSGVKFSGYGVELGPLGILEFTNAKTITIG